MSNNGGSCPRCGGWANGRFCGNCGAEVAPQAPAPSPPPPKSNGGTPKYVTALAAVLAIIALGAGGYLVADHLNKGKQTQSTSPTDTIAPHPTSEPSTSSSSTQHEQPGPSSESATSNPPPSTVTETQTETQTREPSADPQEAATNELNSWASSDSARLDRNDTWGASLGMMWPGVKDAHIMKGKTMSASDILTYYRGLQARFPGETYLVRANEVGKQNSNHAAHPDAWQLLVPLNADDGKDADKWCRENMNGDATFTCARQKINAAH